MSDLSVLPIWKKEASAYERLSELALLAKTKPEMFEKFVLVYRETMPNGNWKIRIMNFRTDLAETLGMLAAGQLREWENSQK